MNARISTSTNQAEEKIFKFDCVRCKNQNTVLINEVRLANGIHHVCPVCSMRYSIKKQFQADRFWGTIAAGAFTGAALGGGAGALVGGGIGALLGTSATSATPE